MSSSSLEAKIVVLGSQGVGKTSLVHRYVKNAFAPPSTVSTIGASFLTKRIIDIDTNTVVRLQIWDTAGQERFRSISKLYYRGANAALLCYSITDPPSFEEMTRWLLELRTNLGDDIILHVVGTKSDLVAADPSSRKVPFERCIAYVAEHLYPGTSAQISSAQTPSIAEEAGSGRGTVGYGGIVGVGPGGGAGGLPSPQSNRSSGFWGQDIGWDCCHEISAKDGEGVEEVFRVITRKLVEQRNRKIEYEQRLLLQGTSGMNGKADGYFDYRNGNGSGSGSFRVGVGDKRRSWLGLPMTPGGLGNGDGTHEEWEAVERVRKGKSGKCC